MAQRSIVGASKSGSITRREARKAVRNAVSGQFVERSGDSRQTLGARDTFMSDRIRERYLGHFGSGTGRSVTKKSSTAKASAKKSSARTSPKKSAGRKASPVKAGRKPSANSSGRKAS